MRLAAVVKIGLEYIISIYLFTDFQTAVVHSTTKALQVIGRSYTTESKGGIVINISSLLALHFSNHLPVYASTKTAVLHYSMAMGVSSLICVRFNSKLKIQFELKYLLKILHY